MQDVGTLLKQIEEARARRADPSLKRPPRSRRAQSSRRRRQLKEIRRIVRQLQRAGVTAPEERGNWTELRLRVGRMKTPHAWWMPPPLETLGVSPDGVAVRDVRLGTLVPYLDTLRASLLMRELRRLAPTTARQRRKAEKNAERQWAKKSHVLGMVGLFGGLGALTYALKMWAREAA